MCTIMKTALICIGMCSLDVAMAVDNAQKAGSGDEGLSMWHLISPPIAHIRRLLYPLRFAQHAIQSIPNLLASSKGDESIELYYCSMFHEAMSMMNWGKISNVRVVSSHTFWRRFEPKLWLCRNAIISSSLIRMVISWLKWGCSKNWDSWSRLYVFVYYFDVSVRWTTRMTGQVTRIFCQLLFDIGWTFLICFSDFVRFFSFFHFLLL